ncbi:MAG TPA: hypothetical protein VH186_05780 [Chloroflexia bacterium]|nr:hypothetical protein [Chloroflexia bacterium]
MVKIKPEAIDTKTLVNIAPGLYPNWSPDGTKIIYSSGDTEARNAELFVANADGSQAKQLTTLGWNYRAQWLTLTGADSQPYDVILFSSNRERPGQTSTSLWVMKADGSQQERLPITGENDNYAIWSWLK